MYQAQQAYLETEILQADPLKLVQLLYRGALDSIGKARRFLQGGDIKGRSQQITKALEILTELATSLDRERGGELARTLVELYDYMQRRLQEANFQQVEAPMIEVENLLRTLLEGWEQIAPERPATHNAEMAAYAGAEEAGYSRRSYTY